MRRIDLVGYVEVPSRVLYVHILFQSRINNSGVVCVKVRKIVIACTRFIIKVCWTFQVRRVENNIRQF